jgi:hypothetical protein
MARRPLLLDREYLRRFYCSGEWAAMHAPPSRSCTAAAVSLGTRKGPCAQPPTPTPSLCALICVAAPVEGLPTFNDVLKRCLGHEGWRVFTSPVPQARLLMQDSVAFAFEPSEVGGVSRGGLSGPSTIAVCLFFKDVLSQLQCAATQ